MWIRTKYEKWYIHELRGVVLVTWVSEQDRAHAACFPEKDADKWIAMMAEMTGQELEAVKPF